MEQRLRADDQGKQIVTPDGTVIGTVELVHREQAFARPREGLMQGWQSWISGHDYELDLFPLKTSMIDRVEGDRVVLRADSPESLVIESKG